MSVDTEDLVRAYIMIRTERKKLLDEYKEKDKSLKQDMAHIEQALLSICNTVNANSLKTDAGIAMRQVSEFYVCNDWGNFYQYLREHDAVELLERRIHQGNFKEFLSSRVKEGLPPGVNVMREYGVVVRKASHSDVNN